MQKMCFSIENINKKYVYYLMAAEYQQLLVKNDYILPKGQ